MDTKTYRAKVCRPIIGDNPAGQRLIEDNLLDFVDSQMMKVGSLAHGDVQWQETEHAALTLLETKTKDVKLLANLLQCIQHTPYPEHFILSISVLADFIQEYWDICYPAPGPRGVLPRRRFYTQIMQRTASAAGKLEPDQMSSEWRSELEIALQRLSDIADENGLSQEGIAEVKSALRPILSRVQVQPQPAVAQPSHPAGNRQSSGSVVPQAVSASLTIPAIDGSNDRTIKQSLLKVADILSELNDGISLSLRLRRYAIWYGISAAPDANEKGETPLMPVSADRIAEYEEQFRRGADYALWRRVEQSLSVAPYWLDGHFLSFKIAENLGNTLWATAITEEARSFISRLPQLLDLSFQGGIPFASEQTKHWLCNNTDTQSTVQSSGDWDSRRQDAFELAETGGLSVAMAMLNDGLKHASEPRDQFYWRLLSADVLRHHKLTAFSQEQYRCLLQQAENTELRDWEPALMQQLLTFSQND
ncbi:type VI secretion-associated protein [Shewanella sp. NFH-SH190041]|uniref:type VI secretion system protein TssA n=1 Tax=Shewanella sp. NFH-SH190041 TaxID=2950245 RepID=UPI0021C3D2B2|nr:type VI secretion system protein TssA [Shewanella sp. NFH-SH190041]BDM64442.1 type VI secretion-associated protein [Shewanella sp. NFH-SH190041]